MVKIMFYNYIVARWRWKMTISVFLISDDNAPIYCVVTMKIEAETKRNEIIKTKNHNN